ncbi:MAG: aminotransferase class IV [Nitrospinota bacterium]|nr:aminotransferase class IV [Nitrospinota bacterium]
MSELTKVLNESELLDNLRKIREGKDSGYSAFYSSQLGGIVKEDSLMVIPFDDHMVHRGHGIFDTAAIVNGKVYDLHAHLDRFLISAQNSKLELPFSKEEMKKIILETTASSNRRDGSIRYWISSGTGNLGLIPPEEAQPAFFVMIFGGLDYPERYYSEGMKVITTSYPIKPTLYAVTKSTNYLPNTLMQLEAKEKGFDNGIFIDSNGHVGEGSNMNTAFVSQDKKLIHPRFENILSGCTAKRLLELAELLKEKGIIKDINICDITVQEARESKEMMFIGSSIGVAPIVEWDGQKIGDGNPGPVAAELKKLLSEDMMSSKDRLIEVKYS